jgi:hypothetical protein
VGWALARFVLGMVWAGIIWTEHGLRNFWGWHGLVWTWDGLCMFWAGHWLGCARGGLGMDSSPYGLRWAWTLDGTCWDVYDPGWAKLH